MSPSPATDRHSGAPSRAAAAPALIALALASCAAPSPSVPTQSTDPASPAPTPVDADDQLRVLESPLPMRAGTNDDAEIVATLPIGATARALGPRVDVAGAAWYEIGWGEHVGWVSPDIDGGALARVVNGLIATSCTTCGPDGTSQTTSYRPDGTEAVVIRAAFGVPTWSPDGRRLALAVDPEIVLMDADGANAVELGAGRLPAWSPDGSVLAVADPVEPEVLLRGDGGAGAVGRVRVPATGPIHDLDWSPDGTMLAVTVADCPTCIGDAHDVTPVKVYGVDVADESTVLVSAADTTIAATTWLVDGSGLTFRLLDMNTMSAEMRHLDLATGREGSLGFSALWESQVPAADGTRSVANRSDAILVVDLAGGERAVVEIAADMNPLPAAGRLSPDGHALLYDRVWTTGDLVEAWVVRLDGSDAHRVAEVGYHAAWQPILEPLP